IMEMADAIAITKADGQNIQKAEIAKTEYQNALHLFPPTPSGWIPKVLTCSSLKNKGIENVWKVINEFIEHQKANNFFALKRKEQAKYWMYESINETLKNNFYQTEDIKSKLKIYEENVLKGKMNSFLAARKLLNDYFNKK
ncbi:MAG: methylmalonyl Co-A mutase-associated GTPase MeaB, partial [Bacteroidota bacterium]